jgi:hypothetical protein
VELILRLDRHEEDDEESCPQGSEGNEDRFDKVITNASAGEKAGACAYFDY